MNTLPEETRLGEVVAQVANLPAEISKITTNYQNKFAGYLHKMTHLDGLEELGSKHALPTLFLRFSEKAMALYDESVKFMLGQLRRRGFIVRCLPECFHCCLQMPSGVSTFELLYLYVGMHRSGVLPRLFRRCLEVEERWSELFLSRAGFVQLGEDWTVSREKLLKSFLYIEQTCPFLENRRCTLYQYRPIACRIHFSLSPGHWCNPSHFQNAYAKYFNLQHGECIDNALEDLDQRFQLNLSDVMVSGLLELTVNVMQFEEIRWLDGGGKQ
ncbi:MAG: YkgJ family cysteine cluster protein [Syntrophobacteraceae bacterium]